MLQNITGLTLVSFLITLHSSPLFCQSSPPPVYWEVVGNAGTQFETGDLQLLWTVGETAIEPFENSQGLQLDQGFHADGWRALPIEPLILKTPIKVYPNPSTEVLFIEGESPDALRISVSDLHGRVLYEEESPLSPATPRRIQTIDWPQGHYFVLILQPSTGRGKAFTIQKR